VMSSTVPFPPLQLLTARLKVGFVDVSTSTGNNAKNNDSLSSGMACHRFRGWESAGIEGALYTEAKGIFPPDCLERNETMSKRIIEIETTQLSRRGEFNGDFRAKSATVAFWLQRKLGHQSSSSDVVIRLGYRLSPVKRIPIEEGATNVDTCDDINRWELDIDESGRLILVRVYILGNKIVTMHQSGKQCLPMDSKSPMNELSVLQIIAKQNLSSSSQMASKTANVVGTNLIARDEENMNVYAILPHHRDGTLLQFCQSIGSLEEPLARYIFRQILQGLKTLKASSLCHRNLSLDTIAMDGDHVDVIGLGWAVRISQDNTNYDKSDDKNRYFPATPGGSDPRFIAPEYFDYRSRNRDGYGTTNENDRVWNGFRDDLWATGLILYSMVVGTDALFTAPIAGDKIFTRLCIKGDVRGEAERCGKRLGKDYTNLLSDDLVKLLQSMLIADPKQRLVLEEVVEHPWVTNNDPVITPTEFAELH